MTINLTTSPAARARPRRESAFDLLRRLLAAGPTPAGQVRKAAEAAGHSWRTMQRTSQKLGVLRRKDGMHGGWTWVLPVASHEGASGDGTFSAVAAVQPAADPPTCLAAYGFEVPADGLMHGVPHRG